MEMELFNIRVENEPLMRSLAKSEDNYREERVSTQWGDILVAAQGADRRKAIQKPVIITYHDLGLNHVVNFQSYFNYIDMQLMLESFAVIHVNAPGQEDGAAPLPPDYVYPSMDQLADQVQLVAEHFDIKHFIGFGVGLGANVLSRVGLKYPSLIDGLFLINPTSSKSTWTEWAYQKMNIYYLSSDPPNIPQTTQEYLMWHHFGRVELERNRDLITVYKDYFSGSRINARNLSLLIAAYLARTDLNVERPNALNRDKVRNFGSPVLLLAGGMSPHLEESITMNARLDPSNSTWMKLSECGMVLEEKPDKVSEAFRLFIQGLGYALTALERRRRKSSIPESELVPGDQKMHIVENPMIGSEPTQV